jgi:YbbR domain-containing protein
LKGVIVEPPEIVLQGPAGNLKKVREIFTEPVDLGEVKDDAPISVPVDLNLPQLRLAPDQPSQVTVFLRLEKGT